MGQERFEISPLRASSSRNNHDDLKVDDEDGVASRQSLQREQDEDQIAAQ